MIDFILRETRHSVLDQILLPTLAEDHPIQDKLSFQIRLLDDLSGMRKRENAAFDLRFAIWSDPKREEVVFARISRLHRSLATQILTVPPPPVAMRRGVKEDASFQFSLEERFASNIDVAKKETQKFLVEP